MGNIIERFYPVQQAIVDVLHHTTTEVGNEKITLHLDGIINPYRGSYTYNRAEALIFRFDPGVSEHASTMRGVSKRHKFSDCVITEVWAIGDPGIGSYWNPIVACSGCNYNDPTYDTPPMHTDKRLEYASKGYEYHNIHNHEPYTLTFYGDFTPEQNAKEVKLIASLDEYYTGSWAKDPEHNKDVSVRSTFDIDLSHRLYLDFEWEDVVPKVWIVSPTTGSAVDNASAIEFRWGYDGGTSYSGAYNHQANALLEWKEASSEEIHQGGTVTGDVWSITLPAGTLPEKASLQWRVTSTSEFGAVVTTDWVDISTTNTTPYAPVDLSPADVNVDNNGPVLFRWRHDIATGEAQTKAELQYSNDSGSSWLALGSISGAEQAYAVPAHRLPTGLVEWRVRTAGRTGVYGPWSQHTKIIVKASPPAPIISQVSASPRPAVQWQSVGQQGYRVLFQGEGISCDTGIHYGVERSAKCPMYLPDGAVTITVQVVNSIGVWSESSVTANVSNVDTQMAAPPAPEPSLHTRHGVVYLTWPPSQRYTRYYVLRDGQPVAVVTDGAYADKTAAGRPEYRILGVYGKDADYYVASRPIPITVSVYSAMLVDMDAQQSLAYLRLHRDSPPTAKRTVGAYVEYQTFAGQTHPTPIFAGARTEGLDLEYTVLHSERQALLDMIGHTVCVKLRDGSVMFAVLEGIQENIWKRTDVSLHFNRIEYNEVIPYV